MNKKAIYFLSDTYFESLYSEKDRTYLAELTDVLPVRLTPENWRCYPNVTEQVELIYSGWGMVPLDEELLSFFPKLQAVFYAGGSIKGIVSDAFWNKGIIISSAASANAVPVAEYSVAQIVLAAKHAWNMAAELQSNRNYSSRYEPPGMFGITIGVISLGLIGRLVAKKLQAYDVSVIAYDPIVSEEQAAEMGVKLVSLDELFSQSDIITCHAPLLDETKGMIRRRHFLRMKQGATFINTARGALVVEPDLISVLRERPDIWALLDVTVPEPPVKESPLYTLPNVVLTPHIAGSMGKECFRMGQYMTNDVQRFLSGKPLRYQVTQQKAALMA